MNIVIVIDLIDTLTNGSVMTARRFADGLRDRGHSVKIVAVRIARSMKGTCRCFPKFRRKTR